MKSYPATVINVSDLTAELNKHYNYHFNWSDMNYIIFGDRWVEGIHGFYFGDAIDNDDELSANLCELLTEDFPHLDTIYINTEA